MTSGPREKCLESATESDTPTRQQLVEAVGYRHPIELPLIAFGDITWTIGKEVGRGGLSIVYEVSGTHPARVYKVIRQNHLYDGDEIRISEVASEVGVGPTWHRAFLVPHNGETYVFMEMDHVGRSLKECIQDIPDSEVMSTEVPPELTPKQKTRMERLRQRKEELELMMIKVLKIIHQLYDSEEDFYYELFSKIKTLAERNIAYGDTNIGNILPEPTGLRLIDFGIAQIEGNPKEASKAAMKSPCNQVWWRQFTMLPNLSEKSQELIKWLSQ